MWQLAAACCLLAVGSVMTSCSDDDSDAPLNFYSSVRLTAAEFIEADDAQFIRTAAADLRVGLVDDIAGKDIGDAIEELAGKHQGTYRHGGDTENFDRKHGKISHDHQCDAGGASAQGPGNQFAKSQFFFLFRGSCLGHFGHCQCLLDMKLFGSRYF